MKKLFFLFLLPWHFCFSDAVIDAPLDVATQRLLVCMQKRLEVMHDVARYKWNAHIPVEDKEREKQVLTQLVAKAALYNLDKEWAETFLQSQMDAAKLLQEHDIEIWKGEAAPMFSHVPDLKTEIRPRLDAITEEIFQSLAALGPDLSTQTVVEKIRRQADSIGVIFPENVWKKAVSPFMGSQ